MDKEKTSKEYLAYTNILKKLERQPSLSAKDWQFAFDSLINGHPTIDYEINFSSPKKYQISLLEYILLHGSDEEVEKGLQTLESSLKKVAGIVLLEATLLTIDSTKKLSSLIKRKRYIRIRCLKSSTDTVAAFLKKDEKTISSLAEHFLGLDQRLYRITTSFEAADDRDSIKLLQKLVTINGIDVSDFIKRLKAVKPTPSWPAEHHFLEEQTAFLFGLTNFLENKKHFSRHLADLLFNLEPRSITFSNEIKIADLKLILLRAAFSTESLVKAAEGLIELDIPLEVVCRAFVLSMTADKLDIYLKAAEGLNIKIKKADLKKVHNKTKKKLQIFYF